MMYSTHIRENGKKKLNIQETVVPMQETGEENSQADGKTGTQDDSCAELSLDEHSRAEGSRI